MKKYQAGFSEYLILGGLFALVLVGVLTANHVIESIACSNKAKMMGLPSDYGFTTGCMVKVGDRYAPIGYIRIVDDKIIIQGDGE